MKLKRQISLLLCILLVFLMVPAFSLSISAGGGVDLIYWDEVEMLGDDLPRWAYEKSSNTVILYTGYEFMFKGEPNGINVEVKSGAKIDSGTFSGEVSNYGTVVGGDFLGTVYNYGDFSCNTASSGIYNYENGVVYGGSYSGDSSNYSTIEDGVFEYLSNRGIINGGKFFDLFNYDESVVNGGYVAFGVRMPDLSVSECSLEKISENLYWAQIGSDFMLKVPSSGDFSNDFDYALLKDDHYSLASDLSIANGVIKVHKGFTSDISISLVPHLRDDYKCTLKGNGTSASPYLISNAEDLEMARILINYRHEEYADKYYKLTDDIIINEGEFSLSSGLVARWKGARIQASNMPRIFYPIGMEYYYSLLSDSDDDTYYFGPFEGVFDGDGHSIKGYYIDNRTFESNGLFGETQGAVIKNLNVENGFVNRQTSYSYASGLIAGYTDETEITNCTSSGIVYAGSYSSGLVGYCCNSDITDCTSNTEIRIANNADSIGGIAGESYNSKITGCTNNGAITSIGDSYDVGGITGWSDNSRIVSCINNGTVNVKPNTVAESDNAGGIAGHLADCSIILSSNNAPVSGNTNTGGIAGSFSSVSSDKNVDIALCQNSGKISGTDRIGGISGRITSSNDVFLRLEFCINRGDVTADTAAGGIAGNYNNYYDETGTGTKIAHNYSTGKIKGTNKGGIIGYTELPDCPVPTYMNFFTQSGINAAGNISSLDGCDYASESLIKSKGFIATINNEETYEFEYDDYYFKYDEKIENDGYPVIACTKFVLPFTDVANPSWYYEGVKYAYRYGIMNGTAPTLFSPNGKTSRAMLVTILYAMAGRPPVIYKNTFTDVPAGKWYTNAVIWASDNGIVGGIGGGLFAPDKDVTREQLAVILKAYWDYCGHPKEYPDYYVSIDDYPDYGDVHSWAQGAMRWAVNFGLISGSKVGDEMYLQPRNPATRAQISIILKNFIENPPILVL